MNKIKTSVISSGVWRIEEEFPRFSPVDGKDCIDAISRSPTKRARVCMHPNQADRMQEMFIAFDGTSYVRPSFHKDSDESFHMLVGYGKYIFFDDNGNLTSDVRMGPYDSDLAFYCRIPGNLAHSLILFSAYAFAHEIARGPFEKSNTYFPEWSQDYIEDKDKEEYRMKYSSCPVSTIKKIKFKRVSNTVYKTDSWIVSISKADIENLKLEQIKYKHQKISLEICTDVNNQIQESFEIYKKDFYFGVFKKISTALSFHVLEGGADLIYFDEDGNISGLIELGVRDAGKNIFVRIPVGKYFTIITRSECLVVHRAEFDIKNTMSSKIPEWAPSDDSNQETKYNYLNLLEDKITKFRR